MMFLAIDLGGTEVKTGLVDEKGTVLEKSSSSVSFDGYKTPIVTSAVNAAKAFLAEHPCEVQGVAVSACGQIDPASGTVLGTPSRYAVPSALRAAKPRVFVIVAPSL